jgi:1,2-diacylglycerol 3-beta-galactosyltransferase
MVLRPSFYEAAAAARRLGQGADPTAEAERRAARLDAGLDPDRPTGLVMFGGAGSRQMKRIATELPDTPLILMCGRNAALARQLRALPARAPRVVVGFTDDVAHWMALADFFIGKPGPGSLSEAVHCGLPVITTLNTWTLPQERYNADWVREQGVGVAIPSFRRIGAAVADVIARLPQLRSRVARLDNRAVFEIPAILESLLEAAGRPSPTRHEPVIGRSRPALTMMACDETNSPP